MSQGVLERLGGGGGEVARWDTEDKLSTEAANRAFDQLVAEGYKGVVHDPGTNSDVLTTTFDSTQPVIEMIPRLVGG